MPEITLKGRDKTATYTYIDEGQGEPLLLLHGFTGSSASWIPFVSEFSSEYRVIAVDLAGHGKTQITRNGTLAIEDYTLDNGATDIYMLLDKLQISEVSVCGYSMGGRFALNFAKSFPLRVISLILESASPGLKTEAERKARRKADNELANKIEANGIEWFVNHWENISLWDSQSPELKAYLRKGRLRNSPEGLANSLRGMGTGMMDSLWDALSELDMPVKLIAGELDPKYVSINREMADLIPDVDLSIVEDAGHTVHLEQPDIYADLVLEFLNQHT